MRGSNYVILKLRLYAQCSNSLFPTSDDFQDFCFYIEIVGFYSTNPNQPHKKQSRLLDKKMNDGVGIAFDDPRTFVACSIHNVEQPSYIRSFHGSNYSYIFAIESKNMKHDKTEIISLLFYNNGGMYCIESIALEHLSTQTLGSIFKGLELFPSMVAVHPFIYIITNSSDMLGWVDSCSPSIQLRVWFTIVTSMSMFVDTHSRIAKTIKSNSYYATQSARFYMSKVDDIGPTLPCLSILRSSSLLIVNPDGCLLADLSLKCCWAVGLPDITSAFVLVHRINATHSQTKQSKPTIETGYKFIDSRWILFTSDAQECQQWVAAIRYSSSLNQGDLDFSGLHQNATSCIMPQCFNGLCSEANMKEWSSKLHERSKYFSLCNAAVGAYSEVPRFTSHKDALIPTSRDASVIPWQRIDGSSHPQIATAEQSHTSSTPIPMEDMVEISLSENDGSRSSTSKTEATNKGVPEAATHRPVQVSEREEAAGGQKPGRVRFQTDTQSNFHSMQEQAEQELKACNQMKHRYCPV